MEGKSYSLSREAVDYVESFRKTSRLKTASGALEILIQQHRLLSPRILQMENKQKLEEAAATLRGLGIEEEAIKIWACPLPPTTPTPNTSDKE